MHPIEITGRAERTTVKDTKESGEKGQAVLKSVRY